MDLAGIPTRYHRKQLAHRLKHEKTLKRFDKQSKLIRPASSGYLEKDDGEVVHQSDIISSGDLGISTKRFELKLDSGPYNIDYSSNGRFLALCGQKGHIGLIDWMTKSLKFETNVHEQCYSAKILHQETMMAVAQEKYLYMYDNQGVELHCIKKLNLIRSMEFLPYHFLLATASSRGYVSFLDITLGEIIADIGTYMGPIYQTCLNPSNAVLCTGHKSGVVAMWTPSEKSYAVKLLCHSTPVQALSIDRTGNYLCTTGQDKLLKVWDLRNNYEPVSTINLPLSATCMSYSHTGLLAISSGFTVQVLKSPHLGCEASTPAFQKVPVDANVNKKVLGHAYLTYHSSNTVKDVKFCPYEDVLGLGTSRGFSSILVPGAGEANYDAMEENPFASKRYRQEREVKRLMDRIPAELISLESKIGQVRKEDILEGWERKRIALFGELPKTETAKVKRTKKKGRSKATKIEMRKQAVHLERHMLEVSNMLELKETEGIDAILEKHRLELEAEERENAAEDETVEAKFEPVEEPKVARPTDEIISKKVGKQGKPSRLKKRRLKSALDSLIPTKRSNV